MIIPPRLVAVLLAAAPLAAQNPTPEETRFQRFVRQSREAEAKGLAEPFRGITATGKVEPGLFPVRSTGVSTGPVREAARAFLAADRKSTRLNSSHSQQSRMPSSA